MDLEAANLANARAGRLTRAGMIACFALASIMLIASLALAKSATEPQTLPALTPTLHS